MTLDSDVKNIKTHTRTIYGNKKRREKDTKGASTNNVDRKNVEQKSIPSRSTCEMRNKNVSITRYNSTVQLCL